MKQLAALFCACCLSVDATAAELSGVFVEESLQTAEGETLVLNGMGLREKFWVDVYVGSLYLPRKTDDVAEILSMPCPWRLQLDFVYKEVSRDQMVDTWREGFENNQTADRLLKLQESIDQFYSYFEQSVTAGEQYAFDCVSDQGVVVSRNGEVMGTIPGADFRTALLEIWLGNKPASKKLKKGMLGL